MNSTGSRSPEIEAPMTTPKDTPENRHRPEVVDDSWAWVSDGVNYETDGGDRGPTGTVHLADCPIVEVNADATLRLIRDGDSVWHRCQICAGADTPWRAEQERLDEADRLQKAREADPDLSARVRAKMARRRGER